MMEKPKCDKAWTNTDVFLALAMTRFCNFHFANNFYWKPPLLYLEMSLTLVKCSDLQGTNMEPWQNKGSDTFLANQNYRQQGPVGWNILSQPYTFRLLLSGF